METLTVVCLKAGDKYGPEYVLKLQNMCRRNLPEHKFLCYTDDPVSGVECYPLLCDLPGWWGKVGLFRYNLGERVLYLDLDIVITGRLDGMVALLDQDRSGLWIRDDFSYSLLQPRPHLDPHTRRLLGGDGCCNSSVMMWSGEIVREIWDRFTLDQMVTLHGDQNWITQILYPGKIRLIPNEWISSYKYGGGGVVRVFHGEPKPHQVDEPMVAECWQ